MRKLEMQSGDENEASRRNSGRRGGKVVGRKGGTGVGVPNYFTLAPAPGTFSQMTLLPSKAAA